MLNPMLRRANRQHRILWVYGLIQDYLTKWFSAEDSGDAPARSADDLRRFCRRNLADFKCPRSFDMVGDIGRNEMGKISKRELRRPYWPSDWTIGG